MRLGNVDPSSFSQPENVAINHISIVWNIDFDRHIISGSATYKFVIKAKEIETILLDVSDIKIGGIFVVSSGSQFPVSYSVGDEVKGFGSKLSIELPTKTSGELSLLINYETSSKADALQWLTPEQTLGKKHPYLFSQCQAIAARSLIPCQDTPAVKFTYDATVTHPTELVALLSAIRQPDTPAGTSKYVQNVPIPSYLLAIASGAIASRTVGPNTKVWAEEAIVDEAAAEFSETATQLRVASEICGEYVWKEYDLLVMPPSFPFGGMENPCLTFVTPTLLAGDKSLTDVIAHEISHSWTGNLVTNENFEHFWLNEGFTTFVEGKIVGHLHGDLARDFHSIRSVNELRECIANQLADTPALTKLVVDLSNTSPEDAFSSVPYYKGQTFLRYIELLLGGPSKFDPFLRFYLNKYKYQSIKTDQFKSTLYDYFKDTNDKELSEIDWDLWLFGEGMPPIIPKYDTTLADVAHKHAKLWIENSLTDILKSPILGEPLTPQQKIEFLSQFILSKNIAALSNDWIVALEQTYGFDKTKNAEIRFVFLRLCIRAKLLHRIDEIFVFANSNFRMKFVRPIYRDLGQWPEVKSIAIDNYNKVKNQMMTVCANQVAKDLGLA